MDPVETLFSLRSDQLGFRPVFMLGNTYGRCSYDCRFCGAKAHESVTPAESARRFRFLWNKYEPLLGGPYHPVIYNEGNVTNPVEFPRELLDEILEFFRNDPRVRYVSLNSREHDATGTLLQQLRERDYPFPIHFIFGLESSSPSAERILGKNADPELTRFVDKLLVYDKPLHAGGKGCLRCFGLDVNLLFLPELYLEEGEPRGHADSIRRGMERDLARALSAGERGVPVQINIHPYHRVDALPFENADLSDLFNVLPQLQSIVDRHNEKHGQNPVHIFIGIEGKGYTTDYWREQTHRWGELIEVYNTTGHIRLNPGGRGT